MCRGLTGAIQAREERHKKQLESKVEAKGAVPGASTCDNGGSLKRLGGGGGIRGRPGGLGLGLQVHAGPSIGTPTQHNGFGCPEVLGGSWRS